MNGIVVIRILEPLAEQCYGIVALLETTGLGSFTSFFS